jgi:hypothetical protein
VSVRGTDEGELENRWLFGVRAVEGVIDRAKLRTTLMYRLTPELQVGVEYNPLAGDVGLLANWRALEETEHSPALILGTSSDRIGTDEGRAYYATLSKGLEGWTGLAVAPYVGLAYGEADDELVAIGGASIRWSERWSTLHIYDSENIHHILSTTLAGRHTLGLLVVEQDGHTSFGLSYGVGFATPGL